MGLQASPMAVPRYQARKAGQEVEWQRSMRYQERDAGGAVATKRIETDDEYLARLQGCLAFYAAVLQSSMPGNPLGPGQAWQYLSRSVLAPLTAKRGRMQNSWHVTCEDFKGAFKAAISMGAFIFLLRSSRHSAVMPRAIVCGAGHA